VLALLDLLLALALLGLALGAVAGAALFRSIVMFVVFGLMLAVVWGRLGAPDLALAEAALGAGLTGALLQGLMLLTLLLPPAWMLVLARAGQASGLHWGLPLASVPALLLGLALHTRGLAGAPGTTDSVVLNLPALLLHTQLRADALAGTLLLLTGLAFSAAGWLAASRVQQHRRRFAMWWLATLSGLQLATLAGDVASFYTGYVAMTLAAYGLVLHERTAATRRAGRVYLVLALLGEALLLCGLLLIGARLGNAELAAVPQALQPSDARWVGALLLAGLVLLGLLCLLAGLWWAMG